jgi:hypothetical protein
MTVGNFPAPTNSTRVISSPPRAHVCPKCQSPGLNRTEFRYPILGYSDFELACICCGLSLWQRPDESPRQTYFRWLMDRIAF